MVVDIVQPLKNVAPYLFALIICGFIVFLIVKLVEVVTKRVSNDKKKKNDSIVGVYVNKDEMEFPTEFPFSCMVIYKSGVNHKLVMVSLDKVGITRDDARKHAMNYVLGKDMETSSQYVKASDIAPTDIIKSDGVYIIHHVEADITIDLTKTGIKMSDGKGYVEDIDRL
jgi:hypothetical protein